MERISSARRPVSIRVQFPVATEANVPALVTLLPNSRISHREIGSRHAARL